MHWPQGSAAPASGLQIDGSGFIAMALGTTTHRATYVEGPPAMLHWSDGDSWRRIGPRAPVDPGTALVPVDWARAAPLSHPAAVHDDPGTALVPVEWAVTAFPPQLFTAEGTLAPYRQ